MSRVAATVIRLGLTFLSLLALVGCTSTGVRVPRIPAWVAPTDARQFSGLDVRAAILQLAPGAQVALTDTAFTAVAHEWLEYASDWSWHFAKVTGLAYTHESFDCDKFAVAFALAANIAASRAGVTAQPLIARIDVVQLHAFGGVPAGGLHALNAVLTDRGLYVYEPQSRTLVPLEAYPNRSGIFSIRLGG